MGGSALAGAAGTGGGGGDCIQTGCSGISYCLIRFCGPKRRWCWRFCVRTKRCRSTRFSKQLETQLTSSEVFTALFELEMAGRVRQLPGKNYVRDAVMLKARLGIG